MGDVKKRQRGRRPPKRPLSPADEAEALALDHAVEWMIEGALSKWDHTRPLGSLNRADLRKLAEAAIIGWVLKRAEQAASGNKDAASALTSDAVYVDVG